MYELSDALLQEDLPEIKKELGDVLLHLVFYAKIGSEKGSFDIADVINSLNEKLIFRHPHIYGDVEVENEEQVKQNWEKLKLKDGYKSVLSGVSKGTPSMVKAFRIQEKVKGIGFEFHNAEDAWKKVDEELAEFHAESDLEKKEQELGDVFFSLINYARSVGINRFSLGKNQFKNLFPVFKRWRNWLWKKSDFSGFEFRRNGLALGRSEEVLMGGLVCL